MARLLILGAGISGHTAAQHASRQLSGEHEVMVVSPNSKWNWIPSNIWVGVDLMKPKDVTFELAPVYKKLGVHYLQAKAMEIHPEGDDETIKPFVLVEGTGQENQGKKEKITYDYLINATGPRLNFNATKGLGPGPDGHTLSVCTYNHAEDAARQLKIAIEKLRNGQDLTFVIGTGHGTCTCQGAAFEYLFNVEFELRKHHVRDRARVIYISNEYELGDFGMGGMHLKKGGYVTHSKTFTESLFTERGIEWITRAHVKEISEKKIIYENLDGKIDTLAFDFAMLIPPFSGVPMKAFNAKNEDITTNLFAPNGFMKVDADYQQKVYEEWRPEDWPKNYQSPLYANIFAVGIAFAPPHGISKPMKNTHGTTISPAVPRTGMPSGVMARIVTQNVVKMIKGKSNEPLESASMANMGAACIASAGASLFNGTAASMTMYPIVPDYEKYPESGGRDLTYTTGEIGLAGHWLKFALHHAFMHKAKSKIGWQIIPE
jgi:sulfide:quinone oxidoreductase